MEVRKKEESRMTQISDLTHTKRKWQKFNLEHAMFKVLCRNPKGGVEQADILLVPSSEERSGLE